jgi:broad specificity phosphatase PhoE
VTIVRHWLRLGLVGACMLSAVPASRLAAQQATTTTTVIIVRHAEKVDDSTDPALADRGVRRADALAAALADAGVQAVYTTQYRRTRDTAAPVATLLGLQPVVIASSGASTADHAAEIAATVRARHTGSTVLIVGHSNTVPAIIQALGGPDVGHIEDDMYSNLFIVVIDEQGTRLIRATYGTTAGHPVPDAARPRPSSSDRASRAGVHELTGNSAPPACSDGRGGMNPLRPSRQCATRRVTN